MRKTLTIIRQSLQAILANKGRSALTILGIVIGIGAVIALISLGNGVRNSIEGQIQTLGPDILTVMPGAGFANDQNQPIAQNRQGNPRGGGFGGGSSTLTVADYSSLLDKSKAPDVALVSGNVTGSAIYNNQQRFSVTGVPTSFFDIRALSVGSGRLFSQGDVDGKAKVAVLGSTLASDLFGSGNPIGQNLTIGTDTYQIIGVLGSVSENPINNPNNSSFVPYTSAMSTLDTDKFNTFIVKAASANAVNVAKSEIQTSLLANHNIQDSKLADFSVSTSADLLSAVGNITGTLTSLLSGIAAISLIVGGIGIMNIMLVSVTERTREIGLRKAVGARMGDILLQFITEAVLLTITGGLIGIGLGFAMAEAAGKYLKLTPAVTANSVLLAVGISTAVGLVFGIYPALRAAKLNPIDALRYE